MIIEMEVILEYDFFSKLIYTPIFWEIICNVIVALIVIRI